MEPVQAVQSFRVFAETYGIFFALFVLSVGFTIWYMMQVIKKNDDKHQTLLDTANQRNNQREDKYMGVIEELSHHVGEMNVRLSVIEEIVRK